MGCANSGVDGIQELKKLSTVTGTLKVTLTGAHIDHETSKVFSMDPYIKLRFSNQEAVSQVIKKGGKQPKFNQSFDFFVNSCFKHFGRSLQFEVLDRNTTSDSLIGCGIFDVDPVLRNQKIVQQGSSPEIKSVMQKQFRVFLNYEAKLAGFILFNLDFQEEKAESLSFRFETIVLRRKTRTFGEMNCSVRVTIGEQVLSTKPSKDTQQMQPVWKEEILTFLVVKSIKTALVEVRDGDVLVGEFKLDLQGIIGSNKEENFQKDIIFEAKPAGNLLFNTIVGDNPKFTMLQKSYVKKKLEIPKPVEGKKEGEKEKKDEKKQEKKQDKKEDKTEKQEGKDHKQPEKVEVKETK